MSYAQSIFTMAYTEIHLGGGAPLLMIRVCNMITVKMIKYFLLFRTFLDYPTVVHTGGGRGRANSPTPWDIWGKVKIRCCR